MAKGWAREEAVQEQMEAAIADGVRRAQAHMQGPPVLHCRHCGSEIPAARRRAMPGARYCVPCQDAADHAAPGGLNSRRGSH